MSYNITPTHSWFNTVVYAVNEAALLLSLILCVWIVLDFKLIHSSGPSLAFAAFMSKKKKSKVSIQARILYLFKLSAQEYVTVRKIKEV